MQHNSATYCDEPEDTEAFQAWLAVSAPRIQGLHVQGSSRSCLRGLYWRGAC